MALPDLDSAKLATEVAIITGEGKRKFDDLNNNNIVISSLQPNLEFKSIIVLAEGWPSWAYAISGIFFNAMTIVSSGSTMFKKYHRHFFDEKIVWWD